MIPNQWYAVLQAKTLTDKKPVGVIRMGEELVLWRDGSGQAACMQDRCAHRGVALSLGRCVDGTIACAYHGLRYNAEGRCVRAPCMGAQAKIPGSLQVKTYPTREEYGFIWIWWGEERTEYPPLPWLDSIPTDPRAGRTGEEIWPFNYARLCENHLDAHHWAYVHGSVMVGIGEYFDEFDVEIEDGGLVIKTEGNLKRGSGEQNKRQKGWAFRTHFRFPNLSMIQVTPKFRSLIIQTPIDEETSWVAVRCFQSYATFQPFRYMIDVYCMSFLFAVPLHRQDFPLFHRQKPNATGVGVNKLLGADAGIAKYLMMRERLIKQANKEGELAQPSDSGGDAPSAAPPAAAGNARNGRGSRLPAQSPSAGSRLPANLRNLQLGRESTVGRGLRWMIACLSYPLLVPSLLGSWVIARFHRP